MTLCLYARCMQMPESRCGCTPAQQSMSSSNPLAFTSRFSAVAAERLPSCSFPDTRPATNTFLGTNIPFTTDVQGLKNHYNSREKAGIPANSFSTSALRFQYTQRVCGISHTHFQFRVGLSPNGLPANKSETGRETRS